MGNGGSEGTVIDTGELRKKVGATPINVASDPEKLVSLCSNFMRALDEVDRLSERVSDLERERNFRTQFDVSDDGLDAMRKVYERKLEEHPDSPLADALNDAIRDIDQLRRDLAWERAERARTQALLDGAFI